uniref:Glutamine-dependent NAD(+) synthetase n=1 Tax=Macrostomum lignano TaxID=282301 RepID=A0A1I8IBL7_9PLAT
MEAASLCTMATCVLNQWSMDFAGNKRRILSSIIEAKRLGASYRLGPELEISGYGCSDHFYEGDTFLHSWQVLRDLLIDPATRDIVCDVGMPVRHLGVAYNCRVVFLNGQACLLIRPENSKWLTDRKLQGNPAGSPVGQNAAKLTKLSSLPDLIESAIGQSTAPFGDAVLAFRDASLGFETCEEIWTIGSSHIDLFLNGVDIVVNSSAVLNKAGGLYLYSNLRGCDGERVYYDGSALVAMNGRLVAQSRQFALEEVEVTSATVDLEEIRNYRQANRSHCQQSAEAPALTRIAVPQWRLCRQDVAAACQSTNLPMEPRYHTPEEEIALGPACWLWDYLRRSGQSGYFLPLSGGIDSTATSCLVYSMSVQVFESVQSGCQEVLQDLRRIVRDPQFLPGSPQDICSRLFTTCYMGSENSSSETRQRAEQLAKEIGASHLALRIDAAVSALVAIFVACTGLQPKFRAHGGSAQENLALQNVQARVRMVLAYLFAQLVLLARGLTGNLLVLGSANLDEGLRGYMTKYDCSSADVNPIGGISKSDLRSFIRYSMRRHGISILGEIFSAPPTAELEPLAANGQLAQTDEVDMGMTYDELSAYGRLRKLDKCGPVAMFLRLRRLWPQHSAKVVADKVKHFFRSYSINRHKVTVLTPSYHAEAYNIDDNRFDHRQFLYNVNWPWQFQQIDQLVDQMAGCEPVLTTDKMELGHPESSNRAGGTGAGNSGSTYTTTGTVDKIQTNDTTGSKKSVLSSSVGYQGCVRLLAQIGRQRATWRGGIASTPIPPVESAAAKILASGNLAAARRRPQQQQQQLQGRIGKRTSPLAVKANNDSGRCRHRNQSNRAASKVQQLGNVEQAPIVARLTLSPRGCRVVQQQQQHQEPDEPTGHRRFPAPRMRLAIP